MFTYIDRLWILTGKKYKPPTRFLMPLVQIDS